MKPLEASRDEYAVSGGWREPEPPQWSGLAKTAIGTGIALTAIFAAYVLARLAMSRHEEDFMDLYWEEEELDLHDDVLAPEEEFLVP